MIGIGKYAPLLLCLALLCSCGFFEREPLSEKEIREYIFSENQFSDIALNVYSRGAVGGYAFVVKMGIEDSDAELDKLNDFKLLHRFEKDDSNRTLVMEMFQSSVAEYFSDSKVPDWIPKEGRCREAVSLYKKEKNGLIVYLYRGVGHCDELFFFGTLD